MATALNEHIVTSYEDELINLNKAISEFQRATGTTLSANNVTVSQKQEFQYVPNRKNTAANSRFFSK